MNYIILEGINNTSRPSSRIISSEYIIQMTLTTESIRCTAIINILNSLSNKNKLFFYFKIENTYLEEAKI